MIARPADSSGDILPVLSPSDLLSGPASCAAGLRDHLNLYPGDWWETPDRGNPILDLISLSRRTERDAETLSACLTSWLEAFPDVQNLSEVRASFSGHVFTFTCTVHTEAGETFSVHYAAP